MDQLVIRMVKRKESFEGYISTPWVISKYNHSGMGSWHECIGIDMNIATEKGMEKCYHGYKRIKVKVTIEELGD